MDNVVMKDAKAKFADARNLCPGMSDEIYALTDYISTVINNDLNAWGFPLTMVCVMDDLDKKKCGFKPSGAIEFPEYLAEHNLQARAQLPYILQVIDILADEKFADTVRELCQEALNWNIPARISISAKETTRRAYVNAAVDWWTDVIQHPKMDNGTSEMAMLMMMFGGTTSRRQLTADELQTFREALAEIVNGRFDAGDRDVILSVDYSPNRLLAEAGDKIGLGQFSYPCKTTMWISDTQVRVSYGYGTPPQTLWEASSDTKSASS